MIKEASLATAQSVATLGKECATLTSYLPKSFKTIGRECTEVIFKQLSQDETVPYEDRLYIASNIRQIIKHSQNQRNVMEIANKYLSTPKTDEPKTLDEDWFDMFLDECKTISNIEVQEIWEKILAKECDGTHFPKSFLLMLKSLEPSTAKLFQKLNDLKFSLVTSDGEVTENLLCIKDDFPPSILNASNLIELESAGLIYQKDSSYIGFTFQELEDRHCYILYHNRRINLQLNQDNTIWLGTAIFTSNAELLSDIIESSINEDYLDYLVKQLAEYNAELV